MKKFSKYLFACSPFLLMMGITFAIPNIIILFMIIYYMDLGYYQGLEAAYASYMNNLNLITCVMYICALIPIALWYYFKFYKVKKKSSRLRYYRPSSVGYTVLLAFGVSHAISLLFILIAVIMPQSMENYNNLVENSGFLSYSVIWFISTLVLPPLVEELLFRGLIMGKFRRAGSSFLVANILQALLFGVFHMNLVQGIYAFFLGLVMGYLVQKYHTLLASMTFHAFFNFFGTFLTDMENKVFNEYLQFLAMILGILFTVIALYLISRQQNPVRRNTIPVIRETPYDDFYN